MNQLPPCNSLYSSGLWGRLEKDESDATQQSLFAAVMQGAGPIPVPVQPKTREVGYRDTFDRLASFWELTSLPPFLVNPASLPEEQVGEVQLIMDSLRSWSHIPYWGCFSCSEPSDMWVIDDHPSPRIVEAIGNVVKVTEFMLRRLESNQDPRYIIRHLAGFTEFMEAVRAFHAVAVEVKTHLESIATTVPPDPRDFAEKATKAFGEELARQLSMGRPLEYAMQLAQSAAWGAFPEKLRE